MRTLYPALSGIAAFVATALAILGHASIGGAVPFA